MRRTNWRWFALMAVLVVLLLIVVSCLLTPNQPTAPQTSPDPLTLIRPYATDTPTPPPNQGGQATDGGLGQQGGAVVTAPAIVTASPTPQGFVYSPGPSATPTDDSVLRFGSQGQAVRTLQQSLKTLGYYSGSVDGDFGVGTETALKAFQRTNGLSADGVAGPNTFAALTADGAKRATAAPQRTASPTANPGSRATARPTPQTYTPSTLAPGKRFLQLGSTGSDVSQLQRRLKELGYYYGTVSGTFDAGTETAVIAFQQRNGLYADGVAGQDTQNAIYSNNALPAASGGSAVTTTYRALKLDMTGDDVRDVQARLITLGYYSGRVDGTYGMGTASAVQAFQRRNGLTADGVAGGATQTKLYSSTAVSASSLTASGTDTAPPSVSGTLQLGSTGTDVRKLQERLFDLGYYTGSIDGIYGEGLASAVRAFQAAHSLTIDGRAGTRTQTVAYSAAAKRASAANANYTTLRSGDTGERVRALQTLLSSYGYFNASVDGRYESGTVLAIQKFQAQNGLTVDGVAGPATQQLLYLGNPKRATDGGSIGGLDSASFTALKQGMSGNDVMVMQQYLNELGYYVGPQNGVFDAATFIAVQAFQQRNGLTADGVAGQQTLALLYSGDAEMAL